MRTLALITLNNPSVNWKVDPWTLALIVEFEDDDPRLIERTHGFDGSIGIWPFLSKDEYTVFEWIQLPMSKAEFLDRKQIGEPISFLKKHPDGGFEGEWALDTESPLVLAEYKFTVNHPYRTLADIDAMKITSEGMRGQKKKRTFIDGTVGRLINLMRG